MNRPVTRPFLRLPSNIIKGAPFFCKMVALHPVFRKRGHSLLKTPGRSVLAAHSPRKKTSRTGIPLRAARFKSLANPFPLIEISRPPGQRCIAHRTNTQPHLSPLSYIFHGCNLSFHKYFFPGKAFYHQVFSTDHELSPRRIWRGAAFHHIRSRPHAPVVFEVKLYTADQSQAGQIAD